MTKIKGLCGAVNCSNSRRKNPNLSFFRFPKDSERCQKWVINTENADLMDKNSDYLYKNIKLCALHFEESQFMNQNRNKLVWNAIPTLFGVSSKPKILIPEYVPLVTKSVEPAVEEVVQCEVSTVDYDHSYSKSSENLLSEQANEINRLKGVIENLKITLKKKNDEVRRLRYQAKKQRKQTKFYRNKIKNLNNSKASLDTFHVKQILSKYMTKDALNIVLSHIKVPSKKSVGNRWNEDVKLFCSDLLSISPKAYRFLLCHFHLPGVRTLERLAVGRKLKCDLVEVEEKSQLLNEKMQT